MDLIADALLIAGALGAAIYCRTLARRLGALRDMDSGLGAAIATLSRQVDGMRASLEAAKTISGDQTREVAQLTARAEMAAGRLELLLASLHEGGEQRPVGGESSRRRTAREAAPRKRTAPAWQDDADAEDDTPQTPEAIEERAAVEAVLRSLSRNRTDAGDLPPPSTPRATPPARRPSIFDVEFDEDEDEEARTEALTTLNRRPAS